MSAPSEDVWRRESRLARAALEANALSGAFDVELCRREHRTLGVAEGLFSDAVRLVLTGHLDEAARYFEIIQVMADSAYVDRECFIYSDVSFARFVAMRAKALSLWALGRDPASAFALMSRHLLESSGEVDNAVTAARVCLHLAATGEWRAILSVRSTFDQQATKSGVELLKILKALAYARLEQATVAPIGKSMARWFANRVSSRYSRAFDPEYSSPEIVIAARLRADLLQLDRPAYDIIMTIREERR